MAVPSSDPRLQGIIEQYERARLFLREAQQASDPVDRFRGLIASLYFARAIVEIMLEAAVMEVVKVTRDDLEQRLIRILPGYLLIEKVRIHDFHRFGVIPISGISMGGLIKLRAQSGHASLALGPKGPEISTSGQSQVIQQRALCMAGERVFDDESGRYMTLEQLLTPYLEAVPRAIEEFRSL